MEREEMMKKACELCEIKHKLQTWVKEELDNRSKEDISTQEMGQVIDMIKDLSEAHKECMESIYYESVVEAMDEASAYRMGYGDRPDRRMMNARYPDDIMFKPMVSQEPYVDDYLEDNGRYGYSGGRGGSGRSSGSGSSRGGGRSGGRGGRSGGSSGGSSGSSGRSGYYDPMDDYDSYERENRDEGRYGRAYDRYREMKRHYTETKDPADKEEMSMAAQDHIMETISSARDIWKNADPDMRVKMKSDFQRLVSEMT